MTATTAQDRSGSASAQQAIVPCRYAGRCGALCRHAHGDMLDPDIFADMDCVQQHRHRDLAVFLAAALALAVFAFWATYSWYVDQGLATLEAASTPELQRSVSRLEREIGKYGILPLAIAQDRDVGDFLKAADRSEAARAAMSAYLARLNTFAGTEQTYLIDPDGMVAASSNWRDAASFVGRDLSYRPYFRDARPDGLSGYYGIGTTGNTPGYYLATALEAEGRRTGVVAIKIDLGQLEKDWLGGTDRPVLVSDANGVVVLASRPDWKYRSLGPLAPDKVAQLDSTQQYNRHVLDALAWRPGRHVAKDSMLVEIDDGGGARSYLADRRYIDKVDMTITVLSDFSRVRSQAAERASIATGLVLLIALSLRALNQRRLAIQERLMARDALHEAYTRLKQRFEERAQELRTTNEDLRREVGERARAVSRMQSFQDELIRTENLAVIGQLSAGLAHEINQPLAALSTLSENAVRFLELNDTGTVRHNLGRICDLVRRMGVLTGQLRSFARRTDGEIGAVDATHAVENAVALLGHRIRKEHVEIAFDRPQPPIRVLGDAVRLEQVLVNLVSNALDAVLGNGEPRIDIRIGAIDEEAFIEVVDNGYGLSTEVMARLFEPFFTTKKTSGLGLGLAISQDIVRRLGGELTAANAAEGGACFRVTLRRAPPEAAQTEKTHG